MEQLSRSHLNHLIQSHDAPLTNSGAATGSPFISMYIPKETLQEDSQNSQQKLNDMVKKVELLMAKHYPDKTAKLNAIYGKLKNALKYGQSVTGYAIFESKYLSGFFPVTSKIRELAVVGKSFHVKPLLNEIQNQNRYYVVTLEDQMIYLWEGDGHSLEKKAVYVNPQAQKKDGSTQKNSFQRHEVRVILKFYKNVISRIKKQVMNPYDPIYLVAKPSLRALYMGINRQKNLIHHPSLDMDPRDLTPGELHDSTWTLASKELYRKAKRMVKDYRLYQLSGRTIESLTEIAKAAAAGRIESLLIQKDLFLWGEYQKTSGKIQYAESLKGQPTDDIFDDIAEDVIRKGGKVYLMDPQDMPRNLSAWAVVRKFGKSYI